jgi:hypothetical protein
MSRGLRGDYPLYPLRTALFLAYGAMGGLPTYTEVQRLYDTILGWREWVRERQPRGSELVWTADQLEELSAYRDALRRYARSVIDLLLKQLEAKDIAYERPALPQLPAIPPIDS